MENQYKIILGKDFSIIWNFNILDDWLSEAKIPKEDTGFITKLLNELKKHKADLWCARIYKIYYCMPSYFVHIKQYVDLWVFSLILKFKQSFIQTALADNGG